MNDKFPHLAALILGAAALAACSVDGGTGNSSTPPAGSTGTLQQTVFDYDEPFEPFTVTTPVGVEAVFCNPTVEEQPVWTHGICTQTQLSFYELPDGDWEVVLYGDPAGWDQFTSRRLIVWHY